MDSVNNFVVAQFIEPESKSVVAQKESLRADEISEAIPKENVVVQFIEPKPTNVIAQLVERNVVAQFIGQILNIFTTSVEAADLPTSTDLQPTLEVQITDEIKNLATVTLKSNPVLIYEYVRNNFVYEPYFGSLKGAQETLWEKAGNDFDQASLLIALFRAAGIPARYIYGTVEIPIERAMNWVGVEDKRTCGDLFASAGIPTALVIRGGEISSLQIEHCWVEAWIDYFPSGGVINKVGDTWISLDPSFKQYFKAADIEEIDISSKVIFNPDDYLASVKIQNPLNVYISQIQQYITSNLQDKHFGNVFLKGLVKEEKLEILPGSLPYKVITILSKNSTLSSTLSYRITFIINGINYTIDTIDLGTNRKTLSYIPATTEDEVLVNSYGGIYHVPSYLMQVKPVIKFDGVIKATGESINIGTAQILKIEFNMPDGMKDIVEHNIIAGGHYGIGIVPDEVSAESIIKNGDNLLLAFKRLSQPELLDWDNLSDDELGGMLYLTAINYISWIGSAEKVIAGIMHIKHNKLLSEGIVFIDLKVNFLFQVPYSVVTSGFGVDMPRNEYVIFPVDGDKTKIKSFMTLTGYTVSFLEHRILEHRLTDNGASTIKLLQLAKESNIPIWKINSSNLILTLSIIQVSEDVKQNITNAVNMGLEVTVSEQDVEYKGWVGVGYIVMNPTTGESAYMVGGSWAGAKGEETTPNVSIQKNSSVEKNKAVVCLGKLRPLSPYEHIYTRWMAYHTMFELIDLGYNATLDQPNISEFIKLITEENIKIFVFMGHGFQTQDNKVGISFIEGAVALSDMRNIPIGDKLVMIIACYGSISMESFSAKCKIGAVGLQSGVIIDSVPPIFFHEAVIMSAQNPDVSIGEVYVQSSLKSPRNFGAVTITGDQGIPIRAGR